MGALMNRRLVCLVVAWLVGVAPAGVWAGDAVAPLEQLYDLSWPAQAPHPVEPDDKCSDLGDRDPFTTGQCNLQVMAGYYKKSSAGPGGPGLDYVPVGLRLGYMVTSPIFDHTCVRGTIEALLEANYSRIVRSFGSYATGPDLILRYNYVQPDCLFVPYIQGGAGFVWNDAYKYANQRLIGERFEFLLRGEAGCRLMMTECVSLDAEVGFQHISNACLAIRNAGINNVGFSLGFTWFFGKLD